MNRKMLQNRSFSSKIHWKIRYFSNKKSRFHESRCTDGLHKNNWFSIPKLYFWYKIHVFLVLGVQMIAYLFKMERKMVAVHEKLMSFIKNAWFDKKTMHALEKAMICMKNIVFEWMLAAARQPTSELVFIKNWLEGSRSVPTLRPILSAIFLLKISFFEVGIYRFKKISILLEYGLFG